MSNPILMTLIQMHEARLLNAGKCPFCGEIIRMADFTDLLSVKEYGISGLYVGVPVKLGAKGIEQVIEITLTLEERSALQRSAAAVKELADIIGV